MQKPNSVADLRTVYPGYEFIHISVNAIKGAAPVAYYSVLAVTPRTEDWIPDYLPTANELVAAHGGKYLARTTAHEQIEGRDTPAALRIVIEWPSKKAAKNFMNDPAYQPHLAARSSGSESFHFLIEGKDDLA